VIHSTPISKRAEGMIFPNWWWLGNRQACSHRRESGTRGKSPENQWDWESTLLSR